MTTRVRPKPESAQPVRQTGLDLILRALRVSVVNILRNKANFPGGAGLAGRGVSYKQTRFLPSCRSGDRRSREGNRAKQTQSAPGAKNRWGKPHPTCGCNCAKQSQTWVGWGTWRMHHRGISCKTKPISGEPGGRGQPIVSNKANSRQRGWPGARLYKQTQLAGANRAKQSQFPGRAGWGGTWGTGQAGTGWQRQGRRPWRWSCAREIRHRQASKTALDAATPSHLATLRSHCVKGEVGQAGRPPGLFSYFKLHTSTFRLHTAAEPPVDCVGVGWGKVAKMAECGLVPRRAAALRAENSKKCGLQ